MLNVTDFSVESKTIQALFISTIIATGYKVVLKITSTDDISDSWPQA